MLRNTLLIFYRVDREQCEIIFYVHCGNNSQNIVIFGLNTVEIYRTGNGSESNSMCGSVAHNSQAMAVIDL